MTRIESIIALLKANTGASTVAPTTVATYANLAETITLETISSGIMATSPLKGAFDGLPTADLLDQMFISLFGYTQAEMDALKATEAGAAGYQYWINELANNSDMINVNTLAIALLNGAAAADATKAAALVADDVDAYEIYAGTGETPVETEGQTVYLTSNQDILVGTDGNDTFVARGNNTLTTQDIIDGGKGTDTVYVILDKEETAEMPQLTNIEILKVQAQATTIPSGDNDVDGSADIESNIDAQQMESVKTYINDHSRADLTIENVSRNSHITTLVMRETDMGDVDYNVFFDPQNITAPGSADQGATLLIKLANVLNIAENTNPVENFEVLTFTVGTTTVTADISAATSYDDVVTAIEAAIAAKGLVGLTVQKQADAPAYFSIDVATYAAGQFAGSYNPILITNEASGVLTPGQIELANNTTNANMTNTMTNVEGSLIPSLTQTNVVFDRVGRDSKGGDFIAGSDSTGASGSKGIEQFNVSVDRDSWLTSVSSTNNTLEVINIENIDENSDGNGSLTVRGVNGEVGIEDVRVIDASKMTGSVDIVASLSDKIVDKYLNLTDDQANAAADNSDAEGFLNVVDTYFSYDFGSNDDTFVLTVDSSNLAAAGTVAREDFVLEINGNDGNDDITFSIVDNAGDLATNASSFWYYNQDENANLVINAGAGNDTIKTPGAGNLEINAGSGNDTVYTDNTGADATSFNDGKATWVLNANNVDIENLQTEVRGYVSAVNAFVAVTFHGITVEAEIANSYGKTANVTISDLSINQAIKDAINNDDTLNKVLVAKDGPSGTLVIESLIDGEQVLGDLTLDLYNKALTTAQTSPSLVLFDATALTNNTDYAAAGGVGVYDVLFAQESTNDIVGADSSFATDNTITLGAGDDVLVLSTTNDSATLNILTSDAKAIATDNYSNETIVFDAAFGNDVIFNFEADADTDIGEISAGSDILDFTAFLGTTTATTLVTATTYLSVDSQITVVSEGVANDTIAEIKALYDAADQSVANTTIKQLLITTDADNIGSVYSIVDGAADNDTAVTLLGTIDLADTAWSSLTVDNFATNA